MRVMVAIANIPGWLEAGRQIAASADFFGALPFSVTLLVTPLF
jgi:hypothetical protein